MTTGSGPKKPAPGGPISDRGRRPAAGGLARHIPVLLPQVLAALQPRDGERIIDGTFGAGGYTRAILEASDVRVLALDRDPDAIARGEPLRAAFGERLLLTQGRFGDLTAIAARHGFAPADGVVLDIGVSSMQLDEAARGFSFMTDGPLDMRMSRDGRSAAEVVAETPQAELADIIYRYGEERRSRAIAAAIARERAERPLVTTGDLARLVANVFGGRKVDGRHPATRTFQALRIFVNDELGELERGLAAAEQLLRPGGRLCVVTFHSLEDRIVKQFLTARCGRLAAASRHRPETTSNPAPSFRFVNHRPLSPDDDEIAANPRARSARLRWAVRTEAPPQQRDSSEAGDP